MTKELSDICPPIIDINLAQASNKNIAGGAGEGIAQDGMPTGDKSS